MSNFHQIDPGTYDLRQGGTKVGVCFVTAGQQLDTTVEHWILFPNFVSPSWSSGTGSQNDLVIRAIPWTGLTPNASSVRPNGIGSNSDFFAIMAEYANGVGGTFRYVNSGCTLSDGVPEQ